MGRGIKKSKREREKVRGRKSERSSDREEKDREQERVKEKKWERLGGWRAEREITRHGDEEK